MFEASSTPSARRTSGAGSCSSPGSCWSSGCWPTCRCRASTGGSSRQFLESNPIFGLLDLFSGGGLTNFSVVALGVNPYINASIIMQLMTGVVPSLQALQREGEYGRTKINQYTRYLSVPMALLQAYGFLALLTANGVLTTPFDLGSWETLTQIVTLDRGLGRADVAGRADHREGDRQRHQLHHLRGHREPGAGRHRPASSTTRISRGSSCSRSSVSPPSR